MTKKITKLTEAQKAELKPWAEKWIEPWAEKWIAIGLSCEPADRGKAEQAYRACYRFAGLNPNVPIVWVQSPIVGALSAPLAANLLSGSSAIRSVVNSAVDMAVYSAVDTALNSAVDRAIRSVVYSAVGSAVNSAVNSAVDRAVSSAVISEVNSAVYSAVGSAVNSAVNSAVDRAVSSAGKQIFWHDWLGGQFWSWWPASESFFREVCDLKLKDDLSERGAAYAACSSNAGYWWPNKNFILACDRPAFIKRDENGRLHSETGHAIEWRDGWGLSAWHGTVFPDEWITTPPKPADALKWGNLEQRRVACEILGWERILSELDAKTINRDPDPQIGELVEVNIPDIGKERFLRVVCGTGRRFALPVPPDTKTALAGNAWTYGLDGDALKKLEIRT